MLTAGNAAQTHRPVKTPKSIISLEWVRQEEKNFGRAGLVDEKLR